MRIFFLDESGYTGEGWKSEQSLAEQPFHVLAAVSLPVDSLPLLYEHIRASISGLKIDGVDGESMGKGFEIKAREIARGNGYWAKHEFERNAVRNIFLECVLKFGGTVFISVVNKSLHKEKYVTPADPTFLSLEYIYERFERFLREVEDFGICVHDQNKNNEAKIGEALAALNSSGSVIAYHSQAYDSFVMKHQEFKKILENAFGHSEESLGLQIADFFATQTYIFLKEGRPQSSGWWQTIYNSLKIEVNGKPERYGYKEFP